MSYLEIINLIFTILSTLFTIITIPTIIFGVVGFFTRKKFAPAQEKLNYAILIAGRNEEKVIANIIDSIHRANYPQDKLHIFVIAHNCTDKTAEIARQNGATVFEYNNPNEKTKGYALRYAVQRIKNENLRGGDTVSFDGYFVFDADNILDAEFFNKMNDAFIAEGRKNVITSFRNTKNWGSNVLSDLYGLMFATTCRFELRGRTKLGCSARVLGTGFLSSPEALKYGWNNVKLSEDTEFTADLILRGIKVVYCDEAVCYDEQPTDLKTMFRQRLRWAKGSMQVLSDRFVSLILNLFSRKSKRKETGKKLWGSTFDVLFYITPLGIINFALFVFQTWFTACAPIFGFSTVTIWLNWAVSLLQTICFGYLGLVFSGIVVLIAERKRIPKLKWYTALSTILLWPIFSILSWILQLVAIFKSNITWKPIAHKIVVRQDKVGANQAVGNYIDADSEGQLKKGTA